MTFREDRLEQLAMETEAAWAQYRAAIQWEEETKAAAEAAQLAWVATDKAVWDTLTIAQAALAKEKAAWNETQ